MGLVLKTGPAVEPVTLAEAKLHLRVEPDQTDEDTLIGDLIVAARQHIELVTGRAFVTQTWQYVLDAFPSDEIRLPRPPLQSVTSVKYKLEDGTDETLDSGQYVVDITAEPGLIVTAPGYDWPTDTLYPSGAVTVEYKAGYGDAASDVPTGIKQGLLLLLGHWYENRETVVVGQTGNSVPFAADALLWPYRVWWYQP